MTYRLTVPTDACIVLIPPKLASWPSPPDITRILADPEPRGPGGDRGDHENSPGLYRECPARGESCPSISLISRLLSCVLCRLLSCLFATA